MENLPEGKALEEWVKLLEEQMLLNAGIPKDLFTGPASYSPNELNQKLFDYRSIRAVGTTLTTPKLTLDILEERLKTHTDPVDFFGTDKADFFNQARLLCYPYISEGDGYNPNYSRAYCALTKVEELAWQLEEAPKIPSIQDNRSWLDYTLGSLLGTGSVADVYEAISVHTSEPVILKLSRSQDGNELLDTEKENLEHVLANAKISKNYKNYFPDLSQSFTTSDGLRCHVFESCPGMVTLEQVHARHPVLEGRHIGWIFNRLLEALGFVHSCGLIHGAIVPSHVLIHPENHGAMLVGWGQSVQKGEPITRGTARYRDFYPPEVSSKQPADTVTDIYMAARCMLYLAGYEIDHDFTIWEPGESLPKQIKGFLKSCVLPGVKMRPRDAWGLHKDFGDILQSVYGSPKFVALDMS